MTVPTGAAAIKLSETARKGVVEAVHAQLVPGTWRDLCTAERAAVTHEDVLRRIAGGEPSEDLRAYLDETSLAKSFEKCRLVAAIKDEIAIERAEAKLPSELWRRANKEAR